jgi:hypothetical protein
MSNVTKGPVTPWRIQVPSLTFTDAGALSAARVEVFYKQEITVDGLKLTNDLPAVAWETVATKDQPVSVTLPDGSTVQTTRGAILAAVLAIAAEEQAKANPPAP